MKAYTENWQKYLDSVVYARIMVPYIIEILEKTNNLKGLFTEIINQPAFDTNELSISQIVSIVERAYTFETDLKRFRNQSAECTNIGLNLRGVIACAACSFRSEKSFPVTPTPQIAITPESCNILVDYCMPAWKFVVNTNLMVYLMQILQKKTGNTEFQGNYVIPDMILNTGLTVSQVLDFTDLCPTGSPDISCP